MQLGLELYNSLHAPSEDEAAGGDEEHDDAAGDAVDDAAAGAGQHWAVATTTAFGSGAPPAPPSSTALVVRREVPMSQLLGQFARKKRELHLPLEPTTTKWLTLVLARRRCGGAEPVSAPTRPAADARARRGACLPYR